MVIITHLPIINGRNASNLCYILGVMPDYEMEDILMNVFGRRGHPLRKFWRMMYWMPKFKNLSPWVLPDPLPNDSLDLAKLAIERISSVDVQAKINIYNVNRE